MSGCQSGNHKNSNSEDCMQQLLGISRQLVRSQKTVIIALGLDISSHTPLVSFLLVKKQQQLIASGASRCEGRPAEAALCS